MTSRVHNFFLLELTQSPLLDASLALSILIPERGKVTLHYMLCLFTLHVPLNVCTRCWSNGSNTQKQYRSDVLQTSWLAQAANSSCWLCVDVMVTFCTHFKVNVSILKSDCVLHWSYGHISVHWMASPESSKHCWYIVGQNMAKYGRKTPFERERSGR